jgi:hypothetical protein
MTAYEFYWREAIEGAHLIGILPERRKNPERITQESIMNWGRIILGDLADLSNLFFVQVTIDEETGVISYLSPSFRRKKKT